MNEPAKLVLEDGSILSGRSFGHFTSASGEIVFSTGMTGYPESLTDPSFRGQILVLTYPLIGNYGVPENIIVEHLSRTLESEKVQISGLIVSDYSSTYSHHSAKKSLSAWLVESKIPALYGIDTRELTKKLRERGVMLGKIVCGRDIGIEDPNSRNLVSEASIKYPAIYGKKRPRILLVDCGVKHNIIRCLLARDVSVIRVPWDFDIFSVGFDGIMISNGPGDPKMCKPTISNIRKAMERKIPVFGVCLGNQILALAAGADTYKLSYGHRGQNQPCKDLISGRSYITSQNHGYAVDAKNLPSDWSEWFRNLNDSTNEGIIHKSGRFMSVQFHPEASPGPRDCEFLFDRFLDIVRNKRV